MTIIDESYFAQFTIAYCAFLAGIVYELQYLLDRNWKDVFRFLTIGFCISIVCLIPGCLGTQTTLDQFRSWPYYFVGCLLFTIFVLAQNKVTPQIGKGTTLIHTVAVNYWIWDIVGGNGSEYFWLYCGPVSLISLLALAIILNPKKKSRASLAFLSIWSTVILLTFATQYILLAGRLGSVEKFYTQGYWLEATLTMLYLFILGASSIYIFCHLMMVGRFLPDEDGTLRYSDIIKAAIKEHIDRYSTDKLNPRNAILSLAVATISLYLNSVYEFVNPYLAIAFTITFVPTLFRMANNYSDKRESGIF